MDADRLLAEVLDNVFPHICRYADDIHEIHVVVALRMLYTANACSVTVYKCQYMELLVLSVLLAYLLELKTTE